ncbi:MAG: FAD-binding oxidoreductase, partial [Fimbriimonadaceae bacterium]
MTIIPADLASVISADRILSGASAERAYDCDAYTVERSKPSLVVLPETTDEVIAVVKWCCLH